MTTRWQCDTGDTDVGAVYAFFFLCVYSKRSQHIKTSSQQYVNIIIY